MLGRRRAIDRLIAVARERVAVYGLENHAGVPVYVHAKVCIVDDIWASTGSDNLSRRSWTHDSELTAVVLDEPTPATCGSRSPPSTWTGSTRRPSAVSRRR